MNHFIFRVNQCLKGKPYTFPCFILQMFNRMWTSISWRPLFHWCWHFDSALKTERWTVLHFISKYMYTSRHFHKMKWKFIIDEIGLILFRIRHLVRFIEGSVYTYGSELIKTKKGYECCFGLGGFAQFLKQAWFCPCYFHIQMYVCMHCTFGSGFWLSMYMYTSRLERTTYILV